MQELFQSLIRNIILTYLKFNKKERIMTKLVKHKKIITKLVKQ